MTIVRLFTQSTAAAWNDSFCKEESGDSPVAFAAATVHVVFCHSTNQSSKGFIKAFQGSSLWIPRSEVHYPKHRQGKGAKKGRFRRRFSSNLVEKLEICLRHVIYHWRRTVLFDLFGLKVKPIHTRLTTTKQGGQALHLIAHSRRSSP